ncbi:hypothetical protein OG613_37880 [Streptomyces sp. NBC_00015]|uniref:hypothetical protein n=1 Tax=unclassified Streptomyces TaxID=2593676 RepID=UPI0022533A54|nr:hypothetical protein [Streptomyces sp. NBC_00103]MCX5373918.1 hypothetical protein [Streptomyces sp. NBC_00103]
MITLTSTERDIHRILSVRAREADIAKPHEACLTYKELGLLIDPEGLNTGMSRPPFRTLFPALGHVSMYEVEHGRPMLSALVVAQDSRVPGPGFVELARHLQLPVNDPDTYWDEELSEVVRFWSAHDPVLLLDAAVDRLMSELGAIKAAVRRISGA